MNLTNDSGENDHERDSSSDEDEDDENIFPISPTIVVEKLFSVESLNQHDDDEELHGPDDDDSDTENQFSPNTPLPRQTRLCTILRQSNHLIQLKLNLLDYHTSFRHIRSASKPADQPRNSFFRSSTRLRRLYLPSSSLYEFQTQITTWLQASTYLIDSISTTASHRQCWSQLLLTYLIERRFVDLQFLLCTHSLSLTTRMSHDSCSIHQYACVPEEDAYKLCSILQKGSRFNMDSNVFDHLRRIIIIKSMQEAFDDNMNLQQLYVKQLTSLKQSLIHQQSSVANSINVASIYSKLLLFLSSLYSIKAETMQTLFCQHLLHNPTYSYLVTS